MHFLYLGKLFNAALGIVDLLDPVLGAGVAPLEGFLKRRQPRIELHDTCTRLANAQTEPQGPVFLTSAIVGDALGSSLVPVEGNRVCRVLDNGGHGE